MRRCSLRGTWFPESDSNCRAQIERFLSSAPILSAAKLPVGGVVPHAGWTYSGRVATRVFQLLQLSSQPDVLILFGGHLSVRDPDLVVIDDSWETPLGDVLLERDIAEKLQAEAVVSEWPKDYVDNAIEVQLPLIKYFFPNTPIVVLGVAPRPGAANLGRTVVNKLQESKSRALVIGSTDLTHYGPRYGFMPKGCGPASVEWVKEINDKQIIHSMMRMEECQTLDEALSNQSACCPGSIVAAIVASRALGATSGVLLNYCTSYDTSADDNFVGYAGVVFS